MYENGDVREVMKRPKTDGGKLSFPGLLKVSLLLCSSRAAFVCLLQFSCSFFVIKVLRVDGKLTVFPRELDEKVDEKLNELKVHF